MLLKQPSRKSQLIYHRDNIAKLSTHHVGSLLWRPTGEISTAASIPNVVHLSNWLVFILWTLGIYVTDYFFLCCDHWESQSQTGDWPGYSTTIQDHMAHILCTAHTAGTVLFLTFTFPLFIHTFLYFSFNWLHCVYPYSHLWSFLGDEVEVWINNE